MLDNNNNCHGVVEFYYLAIMCTNKEKELWEEEQQQQLVGHKKIIILIFGNGETIMAVVGLPNNLFTTLRTLTALLLESFFCCALATTRLAIVGKLF